MDLWKSLSGMLTVEFTGADPEKALDTIASAKIHIFRIVQKDPLTYRIQIRRSDVRPVSRILQRHGNQLKIIRRTGLYWPVKSFLHRPVLSGFILILLLSSFYLPSRIFFISVEGNTSIPDRLILAAAENCGIHFAASRKHVRSEKVKNELLAAVPQLQWAGINTSGCTAVISVRERVSEEQSREEAVVSNLVADRDGYILSATVTSGTALCQPGDTVTEGQLLISGYTDCGICIQASKAEGEVLAQTNRNLTAVIPKKYLRTTANRKIYYDISLLIRKKRINLWKESSIFNTGCGRMYEEYYVSLPGGFQLPIAVCLDQYQKYDLWDAEVSENESMQKLQKFSEDYLIQQMVAGQIIQKQHSLSNSSNLYKLESRYICTEMIGREQREQIGVFNGKRN